MAKQPSGESRYQRYARRIRERFGLSVYQYRNQRSQERTGKTLYERRVETGIAKGKSPQEARGHGGPPKPSTPGPPPTIGDRFIGETIRKNAWLAEHGFTQAATQVNPSVLYEAQTSLEELWVSNSRVRPDMIESLVWQGYDPTAINALIDLKASAQYEFRMGHKEVAHQYWEQMMELENQDAPFDREWWFYH